MTKKIGRNNWMNRLVSRLGGGVPTGTGSQDTGITPTSTRLTNQESATKTLDMMRGYQTEKQDEDFYVITTVEKQVQGVLSEIQYIAELLATQKKFKGEGAEVENINQKIRTAIEKIKAYMDPQQEQALTQNAANKRTAGGISVEQNPLIKDMGGMPLEVISAEWQDAMDSKVQDKAELENIVNKKLKDRVDLANKLKAKNKLTNKPTSKPGQQMTPKFQKIQQTMKYIMKEMPEPPRPAPAPAPSPRPYGA